MHTGNSNSCVLDFDQMHLALREVNLLNCQGTVVRVTGSTVETAGPVVGLGEICGIHIRDGRRVLSEVVGFNELSGGERVRMDQATILTHQDIINETHPYGGLDLLWQDEVIRLDTAEDETMEHELVHPPSKIKYINVPTIIDGKLGATRYIREDLPRCPEPVHPGDRGDECYYDIRPLIFKGKNISISSDGKVTDNDNP